MATVGQIVINLNGTAGTDKGAYDQMVKENQIWSKLGVQAPAGSCFQINGNRFYMGLNEIFEVTNIDISSFHFIRQAEYVLDPGATEEAVEQRDAYIAACAWYGQKVADGEATYNSDVWINGNNRILYWSQDEETKEYSFSFVENLENEFIFKGTNGIPEKEIRAKGVYGMGSTIVLKDVIVDFVQKEGGNE